MFRTRIKICGVCRPEDAAAAAHAGADAIGMIRVPGSPRLVEMETARQIAAVLPPFVSAVFVYANPTADDVRRDLAELGRSAVVQLNGEASATLIAELSGVPVLQAIRAGEHAKANLDHLRHAALPNLAGIVLETPGQLGGSGMSNDWPAVRALIDQGAFKGLPPLIAAGGLSADNVGAAIRSIRPYAVDISSGVEFSKREKSLEKIVAFIAAVRLAERETPFNPT